MYKLTECFNVLLRFLLYLVECFVNRFSNVDNLAASIKAGSLKAKLTTSRDIDQETSLQQDLSRTKTSNYWKSCEVQALTDCVAED